GGEMALEVLLRDGESIPAGVLLAPLSEDDSENVRAFGKPMRQRILREAMADDAYALAARLPFGPLRLISEITPHFACRCSRDRVLSPPKTLGSAELRDMDEKDSDAHLTCDFCCASYRVE